MNQKGEVVRTAVALNVNDHIFYQNAEGRCYLTIVTHLSIQGMRRNLARYIYCPIRAN